MSRPDWQVGQRVHVVIANLDEWVDGAIESLNGMKGEITEAKQSRLFGKATYLVKFDTPARTWWRHQTPPVSFWFEACDLIVEARSIP